jgi:hypothetical protein
MTAKEYPFPCKQLQSDSLTRDDTSTPLHGSQMTPQSQNAGHYTANPEPTFHALGMHHSCNFFNRDLAKWDVDAQAGRGGSDPQEGASRRGLGLGENGEHKKTYDPHRLVTARDNRQGTTGVTITTP